MRERIKGARTASADLDPIDRIYAAIVRQGIVDYQTGQKHPRPGGRAGYSYEAARDFLWERGLLDDAGDVAMTERTAL